MEKPFTLDDFLWIYDGGFKDIHCVEEVVFDNQIELLELLSPRDLPFVEKGCVLVRYEGIVCDCFGHKSWISFLVVSVNSDKNQQ